METKTFSSKARIQGWSVTGNLFGTKTTELALDLLVSVELRVTVTVIYTGEKYYKPS